MAKTGRALAIVFLLLGVAGSARADDAAVGFSQRVDRTEIGIEDLLHLTIEVVDAPRTADLTYPEMDDFEVLRRSQSTQTSVQFGTGGAAFQRTTRYTLTLRPLRTGTLTIPPARLRWGKQTRRTESIKVRVQQGSLKPAPQAGKRPQRNRRGVDPFAGLPLPPGFEDEDINRAFEELTGEAIPRSESDLFLRLSIDKKELYVGEQATLTLAIYSRVDLSSVESVTVPKLEGFWSEDLDSPTQLVADIQNVNGVPYRRYLLRRKAIFPVRAGTVKIEPAETDITAGFLFAAHKVHRKSNALTLNVKPLPAGAPQGFSTTNVGDWKLTVDADPTTVPLGTPLTVRVTLAGTGNLRNVSPPALVVPEGLRAYEPTLKDEPRPKGLRMGGRRTHEYLVKPERTGTFTIPALSFAYFDPERGEYDVRRTEPLTVRVEGPPGGAVAGAGASSSGSSDARNVLEELTLQPIRSSASFQAGGARPWGQAWFQIVLAAPLLGAFGLWLAQRVRQKLGQRDPHTTRLRQMEAELKARLSAAAEWVNDGPPEAFYGELERGLYRALELRLGGTPVFGATHEEIQRRLSEAKVASETREKVRALFELCEAGRYAPAGLEESRHETLRLAENLFAELTP